MLIQLASIGPAERGAPLTFCYHRTTHTLVGQRDKGQRLTWPAANARAFVAS
jgi:hypothetical protein